MKQFLFLCWVPFIPCAPLAAAMVWAGFHPYAVFGVTAFFWAVWLWVLGEIICQMDSTP